jgi:hypothetical protein
MAPQQNLILQLCRANLSRPVWSIIPSVHSMELRKNYGVYRWMGLTLGWGDLPKQRPPEGGQVLEGSFPVLAE